MNKFIKTIPGKTILFILCVTTFLTALASALGAVLMLQFEFYTKPETDVTHSAMQSITHRESSRIASDYYLSNLQSDNSLTPIAGTIPDSGNIIFQISDDADNILVRSETANSVDKWDFQHAMSFHSYYDENSNRSEYTTLLVNISLKDGLPENDSVRFYTKIISIIYSLRYTIYAIGIISFLICLACFIALMCASGRRSTDDELHRGVLGIVPFDLLVLINIIILSVLIIPVASAARNPYSTSANPGTFVLISAIYMVIAASIALGLAMSMSARIKQKTFIKNTLTYMLIALVIKFIAAIFRVIKKFAKFCLYSFAESNVVPKTVIALIFLTFTEFIVIVANLFNIRNLLSFWFFEKLVLIPLILLIAVNMRKLENSAIALANGDLSHHTDTTRMIWNLKAHGENLNNIAKGISIAVEDRLKSERMKTELITNVSHDIKTPLTSIINYSELITQSINSRSELDKTAISEYSDVLHRQSNKLKNLIDDLVEASKATTGSIDIALAPANASLYLDQICGEYADKLQDAGLTAVVAIAPNENDVYIMADARRMWRIFDNIMNNICKYSLAGTRVYLALETNDRDVVFTFKNTSKEALNTTEDELLERFVRGDASRNTEGNGLGLSIAKSLAELQGGALKISIDGDLFKVILTFPSI